MCVCVRVCVTVLLCACVCVCVHACVCRQAHRHIIHIHVHNPKEYFSSAHTFHIAGESEQVQKVLQVQQAADRSLLSVLWPPQSQPECPVLEVWRAHASDEREGRVV